MEGKIIWFDRIKNYGFIRENDNGESYFVHRSQMNIEFDGDILEEARVSFEGINTEKGLQAKNVVFL